MTIRVAINHRTTYKFDRAVALSPHTVRLRPAAHSRTPIHSYSLKIKPEEHFINWQQDAFGNYLARLVFPDKCTEFEVDVEVGGHVAGHGRGTSTHSAQHAAAADALENLGIG